MTVCIHSSIVVELFSIAAAGMLRGRLRHSGLSQVECSRSLPTNTMIRALLIVFFSAMLLSGAVADTSPPGTEPEYYYTRVMYNGVGTPERGGPFPARYPPLRDFKCSDLARGEGGMGGGWRTDYPASDCKFIWGVDRLTNIKAYGYAPHPMMLMDNKIFDFPY